MTDLIERLEKATGPDSGIDASIWWRFDRNAAERVYWNAASGKPRPLGDEPPTSGLGWFAVRGRAPAYTASLDAALTLLDGLKRKPHWTCSYPVGEAELVFTGGPVITASGWSAAIALCIAALKARLP